MRFVGNSKIAAGSLTGEVWILDDKRLTVNFMIGVLDSRCMEIMTADNMLICVAESGQILIFDQNEDYALIRSKEFNTLLNSATYHTSLFLGTQYGELITYNIQSDETTNKKVHEDSITQIIVMDDGIVLTSSLDGNIRKTHLS